MISIWINVLHETSFSLINTFVLYEKKKNQIAKGLRHYDEKWLSLLVAVIEISNNGNAVTFVFVFDECIDVEMMWYE